MEVIHRESGNNKDDWKNISHSFHRESFMEIKEFERIDSLSMSMENSKIKSIIVPYNPEEDELTNKLRQETYLEKIKNIGTNLKYNLETIGQAIWRPDGDVNNNAYLLGKKYCLEDYKDQENALRIIEEDFSKLIWFSYRKNFPKLNHQELPIEESFISDTGWGCMIRACQMAFAAGLKRSILSKFGYREKLDYDIISWFLDVEVDPKKAPYSIQTICKSLYESYNLKPGVWLKPSSVLLSLDQIQQQYGERIMPDLQLEVFLEGTIYINQILKKVCTLDSNSIHDSEKEEYEHEFEVVEDDTANNDIYFFNPNINSSTRSVGNFSEFCNSNLFDCASKESITEFQQLINQKWKSPLMITVLAKIGLDKPNPEYFPFIRDLLSYPESLGMIGGKPGLAYYIVGYAEEKLLYLDPHFVQESIKSKKDLKNNLSSYHCQARYLNFSDIDSSVAMTFFIKDENHFKLFIQKFKDSCNQTESFLGIEISPPGEDLSDFESVGEDDEFETVSYK